MTFLIPTLVYTFLMVAVHTFVVGSYPPLFVLAAFVILSYAFTCHVWDEMQAEQGDRNEPDS